MEVQSYDSKVAWFAPGLGRPSALEVAGSGSSLLYGERNFSKSAGVLLDSGASMWKMNGYEKLTFEEDYM